MVGPKHTTLKRAKRLGNITRMSQLSKRLSALEATIKPKKSDFLRFYHSVSSEEFMGRAAEATEKGLYLNWKTGNLDTYQELKKRVGSKWAAVAKRNREQIAEL